MSTLGVFMNGIDTMCKAELVTLAEKHSLPSVGTVAQLRYSLKKYFEMNGVPDRDDSAKKHKPDPLSVAAAAAVIAPTTPTPPATPIAILTASPPVSGAPRCPHGAACPELHLYKHRTDFTHDGFRVPIKCRDGAACPKLKDREHLNRYAHDDDADKACRDGVNCPFLHILKHRVEFDHPGFRSQPVVCRDGASCVNIKDRGHLYKYAHDVPLPVPDAPAPTTTLSIPPPPPAPPTPPPMPLSSTPAVLPATTSDTVGIAGKTLADVPLESAPESVLIELDRNSEEFWELEEKFNANLQGSNEDYVANRIKAKKKPIRFLLVGAEKVVNPVLEARFELKKLELSSIRDPKELRERVSFHGTHPKNLKSLLHYSLLRFKHPLNPCKAQVDDGYFGTNKKGIYVSRYADYTLKYSNRVCALDVGDEVKTIMFRTLPGRSKHIEKLSGPIDPTPGFDSHSSPTFLEWYLFDEAQVCPVYVLRVKAVEDTRTAADDQ